VNRGPIIDRGITAMRSIVVEPMRYADSSWRVTPRHRAADGSQGMNLALADGVS